MGEDLYWRDLTHFSSINLIIITGCKLVVFSRDSLSTVDFELLIFDKMVWNDQCWFFSSRSTQLQNHHNLNKIYSSDRGNRHILISCRFGGYMLYGEQTYQEWRMPINATLDLLPTVEFLPKVYLFFFYISWIGCLFLASPSLVLWKEKIDTSFYHVFVGRSFSENITWDTRCS